MKATCRKCAHFIPDQIGFGQGIGKCHVFEEYKKKKPSQKALVTAFKRLGNQLFWGGNGHRRCEKFKKIINRS